MKKAIVYKFAFVLIFALLISGVISYIVAGNQLLNGKVEHLNQVIKTIDYTIDYQGDLQQEILDFQKNTVGSEDRITILKVDGSVCADTNTTDVSTLENHADREEVKEALASGYGYSQRHSATLGKDMLYVAYKSSNGDYIIRMATNYEGLTDYMKILLPSLFVGFLVVLILSLFVASKLADDITKPLKEIAGEMLKLQSEDIEFNFKKYKYGELNIISETIEILTCNVKEYIDKIEFEKRIRQEFFSNASHELKTPITSVKGYAEILQNNLTTDMVVREDCIDRILKETDNMTNLINDILMISKLETNEVEIDLSEVRIAPLLDEVTKSLKPIADENKIVIHSDCQPIVIESSERQLRELLTNLMTNAIKYNYPEGDVWVNIKRDNNDLIIVVSDNGIGISREDKDRVFERFFRVDKGRSKKNGGTGLGLAIVKHVVAYHDGEITLESELGKGSTFTIKMPISTR